MIGSRLGTLLQVAVGLVLTVLLLTAIELGAGLLVHGRPPEATRDLPGDTVAHTLAWLEINPAPLIRDVDLLWRNQPGARKTEPVNPRPFGREDSWRIENNSEGFRGPERLRGAAADVYRVLCVGDSITFGFNADQGAAYPRQLEALLAERYPARRFEVVNAGVPGWSWLQGLRFLETRGLALDPDVVVIGHGTNDQLLKARVTDEERFHRLEGRLTRAVQSVGIFLSRTNTYRAIERVFPPPAQEAPEDSPACREQIRLRGSCHRVALDEITAAVREVARVTRDAGVDLLVVNLDFVETAAVEGVRRAVEEGHLAFLDAVDELRTLRRRDDDRRAADRGLALATPPNLPPVTPQRVRRAVLRVVVPDRGASYRVEGAAYFQPGFAFAEPVYDDATHGDEIAGDGVFSVTVEVPAHIGAIQYKFYQGAVAEFTPLPPLASALGDRLLRVPVDQVGPVDVFGASLFMAERAHPNGDGHGVIADLLARRLETLPSFRQLVGAAPAAGPDPTAAR